MHLLKRLLILSTFVVCSLNMLGDNITISGRVYDSEDKPIEFATVRIGGTAIGTTTDLKGKYSLSLAPKDTLEVIFSCIGYHDVRRRLIDPKGQITLNAKLYTNEALLDELEVVGFRKNINGMQSIDTEGYKLSPDVSGGSVESLLSTMAGVNQNNEMSSQYNVRGGAFDENCVYINGMEVYRPQLLRSGEQEGLSIINPHLVGNLQFSTGGFPARYADKSASVLDITYREPQSLEAAVSASLSGASLMFGQSSKKFSQIHGVRFKKNNTLLSSLETRGEYNPTYFDYQVNLNYRPVEKFRVNFLGNIAINDYSFKPVTRQTSFGIASDVKQFTVFFDGEEKDRFETWFGAMSFTYEKSRNTNFQLSLSGFLTNELVSYDISGEYWLNQAGTSGTEGIGGEIGVGKYMEHSRNRLKASVIQAAFKGTTAIGPTRLNYGASWQRQTFHDRTREWEWRDSAGYSLPTTPPGVHLIYNLSSKQDVVANKLALYVEDAWYWESNTFSYALNGGVRVSYSDFNHEWLFSPRVNFSFTPLEHNRWNYRAAVGIYYQSPFYKEYRQTLTDEWGNAYIELNRNIKSPRSIHFILATDYTFRAWNRPFKITAEAYYKNLSRMISYEYDNLKVTYSGVNDSHGYITGLDFKLFGQFVAGTDSWISFSLMKTEQDINGVKVPMPSDQRYAFTLYFTDYFPKFPKLKFSLRGIFSDGLTMTAPRVGRDITWFRTPSYKRVDVGLTYLFISPENKATNPKWIKSLALGFDVFNLFDMTNVSSYYWVTDVNNLQYAVPNYLTRRQFNIRLSAEF